MTAPSALVSTLPRPPAPPVDPPRWTADLRLMAPLGVGLGLALWQPSDDGITVCPFRNCTGGACPGCGLTRAAAALFKGDWATSWYYHPAAALLVVQAGALWAVLVGARLGVITWRPPRSLITVVATLNAVLLLGLWVLRWRLGHLERVL